VNELRPSDAQLEILEMTFQFKVTGATHVDSMSDDRLGEQGEPEVRNFCWLRDERERLRKEGIIKDWIRYSGLQIFSTEELIDVRTFSGISSNSTTCGVMFDSDHLEHLQTQSIRAAELIATMEAHLDSLRIVETHMDSNSQLDEQMRFLKTHIAKDTLKEVQQRLIENEAFRLFSRTCSSKVEEMTRTLREYSQKNNVDADATCVVCCQDTLRIYVREFKRWNNLLRTNARTLARAQALGNMQLYDRVNLIAYVLVELIRLIRELHIPECLSSCQCPRIRPQEVVPPLKLSDIDS